MCLAVQNYFPRFQISFSLGSWDIYLDELYIFQKLNPRIQAFQSSFPVSDLEPIGPTFRKQDMYPGSVKQKNIQTDR